MTAARRHHRPARVAAVCVLGLAACTQAPVPEPTKLELPAAAKADPQTDATAKRSAEASGPEPGDQAARKRECIASASDVDPIYAKVVSAFCAEAINAEVPGVALSLRVPDHPPLELRHGVRCRPHRAPVGDDTVFRIASITKPLTAILVLDLAASGAVELDAPVGRYLPELRRPAWRHVTLRRLMQHTAGLPKDLPLPPEASHADWMAGLAAMKPAGEAHFAYSNLGYNLLGEVAAVASDHDNWASALEHHVLGPLGLDETHVRLDVATSDAEGSEGRPAPWVGAAACGHLAPTSDGIPLGSDRGLISGGHPWSRASGAAAATVDDLQRLATLMVTPDDVADEHLAAGLKRSREDAVDGAHGRSRTLGWERLKAPPDAIAVFGHTGDLPHYGSTLYFAEDGSFSLAFAANGRVQLRATVAAALAEFTQARL